MNTKWWHHLILSTILPIYFFPVHTVYSKGQCHEIFCFWFFPWISFPPAPEYSIKTVSNFFENSLRYMQVKVHRQYQRHRWQICHQCLWHQGKNYCRNQQHWRKICHRYQQHRRQIFPPVSLVCWYRWQLCHRCQRYRRQICHRCQRCHWQIATGINNTGGKFATGVNDTGGKQWEQLSNCWQLKMNLKNKFIYMLTLLPKGVQKKKKKFCLKIFSICHRCQRHRLCTLSCEYLRKFLKKFETALIV